MSRSYRSWSKGALKVALSVVTSVGFCRSGPVSLVEPSGHRSLVSVSDSGMSWTWSCLPMKWW